MPEDTSSSPTRANEFFVGRLQCQNNMKDEDGSEIVKKNLRMENSEDGSEIVKKKCMKLP